VVPQRLGPCVMCKEFISAGEALLGLQLQCVIAVRSVASAVGNLLCPAKFFVETLALKATQSTKTNDGRLIQIRERSVPWEDVRSLISHVRCLHPQGGSERPLDREIPCIR